MDVQDPAREAPDELRAEQLHEAGEHHQVHRAARRASPPSALVARVRGRGGRRSRTPRCPRPRRGRARGRAPPRGSTPRPPPPSRRRRRQLAPCTSSSSAWRFVPSPETSTAMRNATVRRRRARGAGAPGRGPRWSRCVPGLDQVVHAREDVGPAHVRGHAVGGQAVVGVALDLLRARAVDDLRAERAADRRAGAGGHRHDRVVQVVQKLGIGRRRRGHEPGIAHVAAADGRARPGRRCRRSGRAAPRAGSASCST